MPTFVAEDLLLGLSEIDELTAACSNRSIVDPVDKAIVTAVGMVERYSAGYVLTEEHYKDLVRPIAVFKLHCLAAGSAPDGIEKLYNDAKEELEGIRDGKFPALAKTGEAAGSVSSAKGNWGSDERIAIRS